jgi:non-homologous end joining protein Ku
VPLPAKVRASLTGVTVSCGVISFDVDLVPATRKNEDKRAANSVALSRCCPQCEGAVAVRSELKCENGHGPLVQNELHYATAIDGVLLKVDAEEVKAAKAPVVDAKTVEFSVFRAAEVEAATLPSGNIYRMRLPAKASKATTQAYSLMLDLLADTDLAFLAELVVKGVSKLYRGIVRDGMLTLTELMRPSLFHVPDGVDVPADSPMAAAGRAMVMEMVGTFDPAEWESAAEQRLAALQAAAEADNDIEAPVMTPPMTAAAEDLLERLRRAA